MASWCWICHNKVNNTYVWYQGDKCHPGCKKMKQDQALAREIKNARKAQEKARQTESPDSNS